MKIKSLLTPSVKKREIEIAVDEAGSIERYDIYLRPMPFQYVYPFEDKDGIEVSGMRLAAKRISHCVVDENQDPIFTEEQILGIGGVAIPPLVVEKLNDLVIEENGLGKIYEGLQKKMSSGASSSSTESAEEL